MIDDKIFSRYSCVYCGDTAEDLDHVVPHSYASSNGPRSYEKSKVVPCCKRCNTYLGNKMFHLIGERASYLYDRYMIKYKKVLDIPVWRTEELEELGRNLKGRIKRDIRLKEKVIKKLSRLEIVSLMGPTIDDVWREIEYNEDNQTMGAVT